jgi:hypothetical protein
LFERKERKFNLIVKERAIDVICAQYSSDLSLIQTIIDKYGIDFWMLEYNSFSPDYLLEQSWLIHSSFQDVVNNQIASLSLKSEKTFPLTQLSDRCSVVTTEKLILLDSTCIRKVEK